MAPQQQLQTTRHRSPNGKGPRFVGVLVSSSPTDDSNNNATNNGYSSGGSNSSSCDTSRTTSTTAATSTTGTIFSNRSVTTAASCTTISTPTKITSPRHHHHHHPAPPLSPTPASSSKHSRTLAVGKYLGLVIIVFGLVYMNLRGSVLLLSSSQDDPASELSEDAMAPWRFDPPPSDHRDEEGETATGSITTKSNTTLSPNQTNILNPPTFHIYWLTRSMPHNQRRRPTATASSSSWFSSSSSQSPSTYDPKFESLLKQLVIPGTRQPIETIVTRILPWTAQEVSQIYSEPKKKNDNEEDKASSTNNNDNNPKDEERLILKNNITLKEGRYHPKAPDAYSYEETARLLTHLEAIIKAHQSKHEMVLFLEEGAQLTQTYLNHWWDYAQLAPKDWTVLQWTTQNEATLEQSYSLAEPWISWLPDLWGTHAYTMRTKGMESIWKRLARERVMKNGDRATFFTIDERFNKILLADELLFSVPEQVAYTSTFPWILTETIRKSIDGQSTLGQLLTSGGTGAGKDGAGSRPLLPPTVKSILPQRNESLLVFMNIRISTSQRMTKEVNRALFDVDILCQMHNYTKCHWIIHGAFTKEFLYERFQKYYNGTFPQNIIHFKTTIGNSRFNKFGILADHLDIMKDYDLVLIKDNDQRIAGFPWSSFLDKKGTAVIAGPLRQAPDESFSRTKLWEISQHYKLHDSRGWKKKNFAPWSTPLFVDVTVIEVHFLEMYFNVFDGGFAQWFFSQVLTTNFTSQDSCWGPDLLWCPAASEYANILLPSSGGDVTRELGGIESTMAAQAATMKAAGDPKFKAERRMGCALIPLVSVHEDTRQIFKDGEAFNDRGYAAVEALRTRNKRFTVWYLQSWKYARGVIAWRQLDAIAIQCRKLLGGLFRLRMTKGIDFPACIDAGVKRPKII